MMQLFSSCRFSYISVIPFYLITSCVAALVATETCSRIHDGLIVPYPTECLASQRAFTSTTFPWTHHPICTSLESPSSSSYLTKFGTFCVYTNSAFNAGRGISLVTTPETAAELTIETLLSSSVLPKDQLWDMKNMEGKGLGLFAKIGPVAVEAGQTILLETPVLMVRRDVMKRVGEHVRVLLERAVAQLGVNSQRLFLELSRRGGGNEIEDIINVNAVRAKAWDETQHLIVAPQAARINHACRPNAHYRFNDRTLTLDAVALRDIQPGEEITFSYGFSTEPHTTRIEALESTWGFTCKCALCASNTTTLTASNTRLADIFVLKSTLPSSFSDLPQNIGLLPRLISLLEEEGLLAELPVYEEILAYTWSALKAEVGARYWADRASKHWAIIAGKQSWETRRTRELVEELEDHWTWGRYDGPDPWEGVGIGHPWDEPEGEEHHHDHGQ